MTSETACPNRSPQNCKGKTKQSLKREKSLHWNEMLELIMTAADKVVFKESIGRELMEAGSSHKRNDQIHNNR